MAADSSRKRVGWERLYAGVMSETGGRSVLASIVGWVIVLFLLWFLFGAVFGAIRFLIRMFLFLVVLGAALTVYFRLRDGD